MRYLVMFFIICIGVTHLPAEKARAEVEIAGTVIEEATGYPLHNAYVSIISARGDTVETYTDSNGRYAITISPLLSVENSNPIQFALHQNYPNPFNPTTTITYDVFSPTRVRLLIYNSLGQKVRTLVDEYSTAGTYHVSWNGSDEHGNCVGAGMYFYRLVTGSHGATRKMLLIDGGIDQRNVSATNSNTTKAVVSGKISAETYTMSVVKPWYTSYEKHVHIPVDADVITVNCELSPVEFLPIAVGNRWDYRRLDLDTQTVDGLTDIHMADSHMVHGTVYYPYIQTWNTALPDTLLIRKEKYKLFWYIDGTDQLVCDFKEPTGTDWSVTIPRNNGSETEVLHIEKVNMNDAPLSETQFLKFSLPETGVCWYEQFYQNEGISLIHSVDNSGDPVDTYVVENISIPAKNISETIDYDYPSLWDNIENLFGQ